MKVWIWFISLDVRIQATIVSAIVSVFLWVCKSVYEWSRDKYMYSYRLNKEYSFKQQMAIKEKLATSKTPLVKAAEELNYRLWNFSGNISNNWHVVKNLSDLSDPNQYYYIKSFVYRFLVFLAWLEQSEKDIYSFDFSVADEDDKLYLKYIKTMRHFFCDSSLLSNLNNDNQHQMHHFFSDQLCVYIDYVRDIEGNIIPYVQFKEKIEKDSSIIMPIIRYISETRQNANNCNYNIWISFHMFLMLFLNKYGLDYHVTDRKKFADISSNVYYNYVLIGKELLAFFERNKISSETKWIEDDLNIS